MTSHPNPEALKKAINYLKERNKYVLTNKQFKPTPPGTPVDFKQYK